MWKLYLTADPCALKKSSDIKILKSVVIMILTIIYQLKPAISSYIIHPFE